MFIQLNLNNMNNDVIIINTDHIIKIVKNNQGYKIYLTNYIINLHDSVYDIFLSKLNQAYIEII